jgi:hypothetical protein
MGEESSFRTKSIEERPFICGVTTSRRLLTEEVLG